MDSLVDHVIRGIPVVQNKQDFLMGVFKIQQIFRFTKYTNRLIVGYDELEQPIYNRQIQRYVENPRVKKIANFLINDPDATFPTNLVLHLPLEVIDKQVEQEDWVDIHINSKVFEEIKKEDGDVYISIIDGQHRIRGIEVAIQKLTDHIEPLIKTLRSTDNPELQKKLRYYQERLEDLKNIELVVTFFIDKSLEYQAMIFSTINRTQKKVSADLVSSLFGLNTEDTPQKTALQVVLSLNGHPASPFYKRIKLYGGSYSKDNSPPLSQATMVSSILRLISENLTESENDRYKERKELHKRSESSKRFLPFRKFYASDHDELISDTLFYYFKAVENVFRNSSGDSLWNFEGKVKPTNILHTTVGYDSLLKILVDILETEGARVDLSQEFFENYLSRAKHLNISDVNRYSFNNRGKKYLYLDMSLAIWPPDYSLNLKDTRVKELLELGNSDH